MHTLVHTHADEYTHCNVGRERFDVSCDVEKETKLNQLLNILWELILKKKEDVHPNPSTVYVSQLKIK